jgi:hypothetical protein
VAWVESVSPSFRARHESRDTEDIAGMLEDLERLRDRLDRLLGSTPGEVEIVFHASSVGLALARPGLGLARRLDAPAARRYRAGGVGAGRIDALGPRRLRERASGVAGSREMMLRVPAALYARLALAHVAGAWPPPATPRRILISQRWAWLLEGGAAWLSGQTSHARPAIARRLRDGGPPAFPPRRADATLLGGTVLDLLATEHGVQAAAALVRRRPEATADRALEAAFGGRRTRETEAAWRAHLGRWSDRSAASEAG